MGKTVAHTPDPDNPAAPSEADCTFLDGLSDAALEAAAKADPDNLPATRTMEARAQTAHVVRRVRAGNRSLAIEVRRSVRLLRRRRARLGAGPAHAGGLNPVLPPRNRVRTTGGKARAGDDLIVAPRLPASSP